VNASNSMAAHADSNTARANLNTSLEREREDAVKYGEGEFARFADGYVASISWGLDGALFAQVQSRSQKALRLLRFLSPGADGAWRLPEKGLNGASAWWLPRSPGGGGGGGGEGSEGSVANGKSPGEIPGKFRSLVWSPGGRKGPGGVLRGTVVVQETSECWVDLNSCFRPLASGGFLWANDRSEFLHLYRYSQDGQCVATLTAGPWVVDSVHGVDEALGFVYFSASLGDARQRNLFAATLNPAGLLL